MNVNHLVAFIKTLNRTDYNAVCVLTGEAGLSDDMRHIRLTPYQKTWNQNQCAKTNFRHHTRNAKLNFNEYVKLSDINKHPVSGIVGSLEPPVNEFSIG
jgi:hypothetical protein